MLKKLFFALTLMTMLTAGLASAPAAYAAGPNGGCPDGYTPVDAEASLIDVNGDGTICVISGELEVLKAIDNDDGMGNNGQDRKTTCPAGGFEEAPFLTFVEDPNPTIDINQDAKICVKKLPSGKLLQIDNNAAVPASGDGPVEDCFEVKCSVEIVEVLEATALIK